MPQQTILPSNTTWFATLIDKSILRFWGEK